MAENFDPNLPPAPQQPVVNPYGFIMSPQQQQKKAPFGTGGSGLQKILFIAGGGAILLIIGIIVANLLFSAPSNTEQFTKIAQQQQEIVRLGSYIAQLSNQDIKNLAATANATISSEQMQFTALLASNNIKLDQKKIAAGIKADNTLLLNGSLTTNTLDATYKQVLIAELTAYQADINTVFKLVSKQETKNLLQKMYTSAGLLLADVTEVAPTDATEVIRQ